MFPDPATPFLMTQTGDKCRNWAVYVYGGQYSIYGTGFGFGLGSPYNASAYTGFSFWAKVDPSTTRVVRVAFPDKYTDPDGGICDPTTSGSTQCWDHYGKRLTLSLVWTKFTIPFSDLRQGGWGYTAPFDKGSLYGVQFQIPVNAIFGVWVDDVAFVK
jgi:hypothetical protein